uniref:Uncharacterized protein n=1 Tax=Arabidopsis thaliana TaxID=3702 RepID=Q1G305_ARATH|nr:unknown protein [Arabidopsis thaliana]
MHQILSRNKQFRYKQNKPVKNLYKEMKRKEPDLVCGRLR